MELREQLEATFEAPHGQYRVVTRTAGDLADSGRYQTDTGHSLTIAHLIDELTDAPEEQTLVQRWNWWVGSLELAYGGYNEFRIQRWESQQ